MPAPNKNGSSGGGSSESGDMNANADYDGFIPIIKHIDSYWYPIPDKVNDYDTYTEFVD